MNRSPGRWPPPGLGCGQSGRVWFRRRRRLGLVAVLPIVCTVRDGSGLRETRRFRMLEALEGDAAMARGLPGNGAVNIADGEVRAALRHAFDPLNGLVAAGPRSVVHDQDQSPHFRVLDGAESEMQGSRFEAVCRVAVRHTDDNGTRSLPYEEFCDVVAGFADRLFDDPRIVDPVVSGDHISWEATVVSEPGRPAVDVRDPGAGVFAAVRDAVCAVGASAADGPGVWTAVQRVTPGSGGAVSSEHAGC